MLRIVIPLPESWWGTYSSKCGSTAGTLVYGHLGWSILNTYHIFQNPLNFETYYKPIDVEVLVLKQRIVIKFARKFVPGGLKETALCIYIMFCICTPKTTTRSQRHI